MTPSTSLPKWGRTMNLRAFPRAMSVFLLVSLSSGLTASEWHVAPPPLGDDSNPGTNELPFATIQRGIYAASSGDTVIVAQGTYLDNIQFNGKNIVLTSTDPLNATVVSNTIIDGNQAGSVVTFSGTETEACILSGFAIQNGNAVLGGGILGGLSYPDYSRATIQNNTITGNSAAVGGGLSDCGGTIQNNTITDNSGGGLGWCNGTIQNNTISDNSAGWFGGGLSYCNGTIQNNTITSNSAEGYGGGLAYCDGTIQNNTIAGNSAGGDGGGLIGCNGAIQNNTISGNSAGWSGGGLAYCDGTIQNNTITGSSAGRDGGGLIGCNGTIQNSTISDNSAGWSGGGLHECSGTVENDTITGNAAKWYGGGLGWCSGTIRNCIIWGNRAPSGPQLYESSIATYSCIEGWTGDSEKRNISEDPRFVDPDGPDDSPDTWEDNNYRLQGDSPCIDSGKNADWMIGAVDLDGNPRIWRGRASLTVDMGAYEFGSFPFKIAAVEAPSGQAELTWNSRPGDNYVVWSCADLLAHQWLEEATVPSGGESTLWTDPGTTSLRKFYRVELRP